MSFILKQAKAKYPKNLCSGDKHPKILNEINQFFKSLANFINRNKILYKILYKRTQRIS